MTTTTAEFWDVNGTSLNTYAWNIQTLGGSRSAIPGLRGEDATVAYLPGRRFRPKVPDSRILTLAMFVQGVDPLTDQAGVNPHRQFTANLRALQKLLWSPRSQLTLTRRWIESGTTVKSAAALAQLVSNLEPTMTGPARATLGADLLLSDPFFYGAPQSQSFALATPVSVVNAGDDPTTGYGCSVTFTGPLTNPQLTNSSTSPAVWVKYGGSIGAGDSVVLSVRDFSATLTSTGGNVVGNVTHSGARQWFGLPVGSSTVTLSASGGSGSASLTYQVPYI